MNSVPISQYGESTTSGVGRVLNLLASPRGQLVIMLILTLRPQGLFGGRVVAKKV